MYEIMIRTNTDRVDAFFSKRANTDAITFVNASLILSNTDLYKLKYRPIQAPIQTNAHIMIVFNTCNSTCSQGMYWQVFVSTVFPVQMFSAKYKKWYVLVGVDKSCECIGMYPYVFYGVLVTSKAKIEKCCTCLSLFKGLDCASFQPAGTFASGTSWLYWHHSLAFSTAFQCSMAPNWKVYIESICDPRIYVLIQTNTNQYIPIHSTILITI